MVSVKKEKLFLNFYLQHINIQSEMQAGVWGFCWGKRTI